MFPRYRAGPAGERRLTFLSPIFGLPQRLNPAYCQHDEDQ
jgi:hypothetical protein